MSRATRRRLHSERDTLGHMWNLYWRKNPGTQGTLGWIFMAHHGFRGKGNGEEMWEMSEVRYGYPPICSNYKLPTIRTMGIGHHLSIFLGCEPEVKYFSKWVEVEAVSAITEAQVQKFIWKNIIKVRNTKDNGIRPWETVWQHHNAKLVQTVGHTPSLLSGVPPTKQQISQSRKQAHPQWTQE